MKGAVEIAKGPGRFFGRIVLSESALCRKRQSIIPRHFNENSRSEQREVAGVSKNNGGGMNKSGLVFVQGEYTLYRVRGKYETVRETNSRCQFTREQIETSPRPRHPFNHHHYIAFYVTVLRTVTHVQHRNSSSCPLRLFFMHRHIDFAPLTG